jgi:hypothetical protein
MLILWNLLWVLYQHDSSTLAAPFWFQDECFRLSFLKLGLEISSLCR